MIPTQADIEGNRQGDLTRKKSNIGGDTTSNIKVLLYRYGYKIWLVIGHKRRRSRDPNHSDRHCSSSKRKAHSKRSYSDY